jgi:hypothetical protein
VFQKLYVLYSAGTSMLFITLYLEFYSFIPYYSNYCPDTCIYIMYMTLTIKIIFKFRRDSGHKDMEINDNEPLSDKEKPLLQIIMSAVRS